MVILVLEDALMMVVTMCRGELSRYDTLLRVQRRQLRSGTQQDHCAKLDPLRARAAATPPPGASDPTIAKLQVNIGLGTDPAGR